jgi:hypothetical protein
MNLMMLALFAFMALGFFQRPTLRTHILVLAIAIALTSAYWLTDRI